MKNWIEWRNLHEKELTLRNEEDETLSHVSFQAGVESAMMSTPLKTYYQEKDNFVLASYSGVIVPTTPGERVRIKNKWYVIQHVDDNALDEGIIRIIWVEEE